MPVVVVGLISDFEQAEAIGGIGDVGPTALARTILYDPRWPWHAAAYRGARVKAPPTTCARSRAGLKTCSARHKLPGPVARV